VTSPGTGALGGPPRAASVSVRGTRDAIAAGAALALVLALGAVFNADGAFFVASTHADTLAQCAGYGVLACGLTVVIITGGIDLAVGSVVALSGVVFAMLVMRHDLPGVVAIPAAVTVGAACGAVSGSLVAFARVQPFVATLAVMASARGLAKWVADGVKIQKFPYPPLLESLNAKFGPAGAELTVHVPVCAAAAVISWLVLRTQTLGVRLYAVGDNETAARYAGVPVRATKLIAYIISGALSGVAGVLFCALERQGNPDGGAGYELTAIAMVVIGGTTLAGGRGGILLTVIGTLTIGYLRKVLDINAVSTAHQLMITGGVIVAAVLAQGMRRR